MATGRASDPQLVVPRRPEHAHDNVSEAMDSPPLASAPSVGSEAEVPGSSMLLCKPLPLKHLEPEQP